MSDEQKPWYHGVRWAVEDDKQYGAAFKYVSGPAFQVMSSMYASDISWEQCEERKRDLAFIASAPETATERDTLLAANRELVEALELILPMARGYAHTHPVGSNQAYINDAEAALSRARGEG